MFRLQPPRRRRRKPRPPAAAPVAANTPAPQPTPQPQATTPKPVEKLADASSRSLLATLNFVYGDANPQPADDDANAAETAPATTQSPASADDALSDVP